MLIRYYSNVFKSRYALKFQDEKMEAMKEIRWEQNIQEEAILFTYQFINNKKSEIDYLRSPLRLEYYPTIVVLGATFFKY